jgi:hypothetical protein
MDRLKGQSERFVGQIFDIVFWASSPSSVYVSIERQSGLILFNYFYMKKARTFRCGLLIGLTGLPIQHTIQRGAAHAVIGDFLPASVTDSTA